MLELILKDNQSVIVSDGEHEIKIPCTEIHLKRDEWNPFSRDVFKVQISFYPDKIKGVYS